MKRGCLPFSLVLGLFLGCAVVKAPPPGASVTVSYWDARGGEGDLPSYDTKCAVFVDGAPAGESPVAGRYEEKRLRLPLAPGPHTIVVEGMAMRDGAWVKRTAANGYLFDHRLEKSVELKEGESYAVNFLVPDRSENITIKFGNVPPNLAQPAGGEESASR